MVVRYVKDKLLWCLGVYDYFGPVKEIDRPGPFNSQLGRQKLFSELIESSPFTSIVETGTFRGDTTQYLHETSHLPTISVESYPRYYSYARARFRRFPQIKVYCMDSPLFLNRAWEEHLVDRKGILFYLDAHWYNSLPIQRELQQIFGNWNDAVVMIDDFQVVDDSGYGYDDYGDAGSLTLDYIADILRLGVRVWFPTLPSHAETGARRGVVVLASDKQRAAALSKMATLREYEYHHP